MNNKQQKEGFSLVEVLVVIAIFAILGILISRSILLTVQGARKSEAIVRARENLNYALDVIQRELRNANSVMATSCDGATSVSNVSYINQNGFTGSFACITNGSDNYLASGSARLTSIDVSITPCSFVCATGSGTVQPSITVSAAAIDTSTSGIEGATVSSSIKIYLRTY